MVCSHWRSAAGEVTATIDTAVPSLHVASPLLMLMLMLMLMLHRFPTLNSHRLPCPSQARSSETGTLVRKLEC